MRYDQQFFEILNNLQRNIEIRPLILGATYGSGGGLGGRSGGFIGVLPQTRVAYDLSESESLAIPPNYSGASLLDNLNHIRYRIASLEAGGVPSGIMGITIQKDDVEISQDVTIINFEGGADVTDNSGGKVTVTISKDIVQVQAPSSTTITDGNDYYIEWENYGDASSYFNSSEPTKIFFNKTGWYLLNAAISVYMIDATVQAGSIQLYVVHSGDIWTEYYQQIFYSGCPSNITQTITWPITLYITDGDNIEINAYNDVGSSVRITGTNSPSNYETRLTIIEL